MKEYTGVATTREVTVNVRNDGGGTEYPLPHVFRHSHDGFSWGYGGSGPSELARCILLDFFSFLDPPEREERVDPIYQDFKFGVIEPLDMDSDFKLTDTQIKRWLDARSGGK